MNPTGKVSEFKRQMQEISKKALLLIPSIANYKPKKVLKAQTVQRNKTRIANALAIIGNPKWGNKTLLDEDVHKVHAGELFQRFKRKVEKKYQLHLDRTGKSKTDYGLDEFVEDYVRHGTFLYDITYLDANEALRCCIEMKNVIIDAAECVKNISILGSIETEIISIPLQTAVNDYLETDRVFIDPDAFEYEIDDGSNQLKTKCRSKLDTWIPMADDFKRSLYNADPSQILIHLHGLIIAEDKDDFNKLNDSLKGVNLKRIRTSRKSRLGNVNTKFNRSTHQIQIKKLSRMWNGKPKSLDENLMDIANYFTKGCNGRSNGMLNLDYKIRNQDGDLMPKKRYNQLLSSVDEFISNSNDVNLPKSLAITDDELAVHIQIIRSLMTLKKGRYDGYLIRVGNW